MTRRPQDDTIKWYRLGLRHLRVARCLLGLGFYDAAVFHAYHAYECGVSAVIAANGYEVPPWGGRASSPLGARGIEYSCRGGNVIEPSTHQARISMFNKLADHTESYYRIHERLQRYVQTKRSESLYLDRNTGTLPHENLSTAFAEQLTTRVREFAKALWSDMRLYR